MTGHVPVLRLREVAKVWSTGDTSFEVAVDALDIVSGCAIAVVGESGSGKSTLLDLLSLALAPSASGVFLFMPELGNAYDIGRLWHNRRFGTLARLRAKYFGYVLQTGGLLPFISVRQNIALPQRLIGRPEPDVVEELAGRLGLAGQLEKRPDQLSVGQRQRVAVARALSHRPRIVLADEPTASVQAGLAAEIMALLLAQTQLLGAALVVATHSPGLLDSQGISVLTSSAGEGSNTTRSTFRPSCIGTAKSA